MQMRESRSILCLTELKLKQEEPAGPAKKMRRLAADKGYDSEELRKHLRAKGIHPQIPKRRNAKARRGKLVMMTAPRFQVERTFSWLQKKIPPLRCPLGKITGMLQFVPLAWHHCHLDAAISGIDSSFPGKISSNSFHSASFTPSNLPAISWPILDGGQFTMFYVLTQVVTYNIVFSMP
ncbi:MAG: transposase [Candidatus Electronema sp. VV]